MSKLDYTIVVPSRKRSHNMPILRSLLPTAMICVDERERLAYAPFVPDSKLLLHPPMDGLPSIINWIQEAIKTPILIEIDDDFERILVTTGSERRITDPDEILAVIENAARACQDLGLTVFCFSRTANTTIIRPDERPLVPVQRVCNAYGVMGAARHRKWDTAFLGRADIDWTLQTLLEDRCIYTDVRFYFDCGRIFAGRGGNVGLVTPQQFQRVTAATQKKWGKYVSYTSPAWMKNRNVDACGLNVTRTNPTAQR
jgi:hypothetical protein